MNTPKVLLFLVIYWSTTDARTVPVRRDLCDRYPTLSWCTDLQPLDTNVLATPAPVVDKEAYCSQYSAHYKYFCEGDGSTDSRAADFCPAYRSDCAVAVPIVPEAPALPAGFAQVPVIPENCVQYKDQFQIICVQQPPTSADSLRYCQQYSSVCLGNGVAQQPNFVGRPLAPGLGGGPGSLGQLPAAGGVGPNGAPLSIGSGVNAPFAGVNSGANINPLSGVGTGTNINAAGIPISSGSNVNFGGLIPGGGGSGPAAAAAPPPPSFGSPLSPLAQVPAGGPAVANPAGGSAPLTVGSGVNAPFAGVNSGANINPLSSVGTGTSVNAAGLPISSGSNVNFGGLIPGGLGNLFGK